MIRRSFVVLIGVVLCASACGGSTSRDIADLQTVADSVGRSIVFVSDQEGVASVASGEGVPGRPIQVDDVFFIGSGSKMITAVLTLRLVDQGLIELDDLLADYVDFDVTTPITIRHLLQHKSGLRDFGSFYTCDPEEVMQGLANVAADPLFEPGARASYSTNGFNMLALVITSVTGENPAAVFRQEIFGPLGMTSTYFTGAEDGPPLFDDNGEEEEDCPGEEMGIGTGGGFASSAVDLDTFMRALFEGDLLTAESLEEMITVDSNVFGFDYGLGIGLLYPPASDEQPMYGHWGTNGFDAGALYDPEEQRTVAVLVQGQNFLPTVWQAVDWAEGR